jgi:hemolysin activation/secretion protein
MLSLGGAAYGRGFETGAASGDSGVAGMLQLTRSFTAPWVKSGEAYVFADGGKLWLQERPGFTGDDFDLASAGAGVRLGVTANAALSIELAQAIETVNDADKHGWRAAVTLGAAF